ncbi:MAG: ABC transporter ATP-binding protein [Clostridiales bacterium]|jgi:branched-chain amino acid transport system ATP-binding protein|nr:ABC transporter ATP-binding protein [Clostridiales bacterium]
MELLQIKNLSISYGPIHAVKSINLVVPAGSIVALLGANGAGKTSTLRAVSGAVKASGRILLEGRNILGDRPYKIAKSGINQSPEGRLIFYGLTVEDNLKAGAYGLKRETVAHAAPGGTQTRRTIGVREQTVKNIERVYKLFPILLERRKQQASTLSGGEQQMLAIGRALMASPKLLLLDEPSLGLAPLVIQEIFRTLQAIRAEGTTILIVEQNALATLKIADYGYVLELGEIGMEGKASDLIKDDRLIEAYLGGKRAK